MELNKEIMKQMRKIEYALLEQKKKNNSLTNNAKISSNGKTGNSKNTSNSNKQVSNGSGNLTSGSNGVILQQSFQPQQVLNQTAG